MSVVRSSTAGAVCTVVLDDPDNRNVLSDALRVELTDALDAAEADDTVRVIVVTNSGSVFCAGADLAERSGRADAATGSVAAVDLFARFAASPKPYVGRIAGHCVAGGMGLAAAMDISIALDTAKMGFTEVRVGVAPAMISVLCLPKMRAADARSAFLRAGRFSAVEAVRMGIVNAAVPADELDSAVDAVVDDLLLGSPAGIAASKQLLARVPELGTDEAFAWTSELSAELFAGAEAKEGMAAFLQKRPASWVPADDD